MKLINLFKFYINSSVHVALAVVSLCVLTFLTNEIRIHYWLLVFVFCSTVVGYNFAKYFPARIQEKDKLPTTFNAIIVISIASAAGLLLSCFFLESETIMVAIVLGVFNFFYAMPLPYKTLREIPFLKVFIIAFIWTAVTLGLPYIESKTLLVYDAKLYFEIAERFCWIVLLMIPFEIRDYNYDRQNLKTLATVFGVYAIKLFGVSLCCILLFTRLVVISFEHTATYGVIYISMVLALVFSKTQQRTYYASFWVEGLPIVWLGCWLVLENISYSS